MTLTEDLLQQMVEGQEASRAILLGWGLPSGIVGPRQRMRVQIDFDAETMPSKTQQSFKDETDINLIMAKFRKTGELTHLQKREPTYGDFTMAVDYLDASNRVLAAQADFDSLSGEIRARMNNSPAEFLAFMEDPENLEEARALGLVDPAPPDTGDLLPQGAAASGGELPPVPPKPEEKAEKAKPKATPISGGD